MEHVFLDFEMNPIPKKNTQARAIVYSEIIEIGAVKLDENYQIIDRYSEYVRPELNTIMANITKLTGITDKDVALAPPFPQALEAFAQWIGTNPVRVYSWSGSDKKQLVGECKLKGLELPAQFRRWMDFQRVYTRLVGLSRRSRLSLTNAMGSIEQDLVGAQHRAVDDAENSASLLMLVKDPEAFRERTRIITQLMSPKSQATTLGDLFADTFAKLRES